MPQDQERDAACDPSTPPHELAALASRRWDLHTAIAANPGTYPELRHWIAQVNPSSVPQHPSFAGRVTPARTGTTGWWVAGCGCLALVGVFLVVVVVLGAIGAQVSSDGADSGRGGETSAPEPGSSDPVAEQLKMFESERERFYALAAELDGNPVAPLVTRPVEFHWLEERAKGPHLGEFSAQTLVQQARRHRQDVQQLVTAAKKRRVNRSGTLIESLVDRAGDGFIDVRWDAASACRASKRKTWTTASCVTKEDALTIHFRPDRTFTSDWDRRMFAAHELAHVYQRADRRRFEGNRGHYDRLINKGLFQGSVEKMADCYALTYNKQRSLTKGSLEIGYGYVCDESERKAIRAWAADINAPMPR